MLYVNSIHWDIWFQFKYTKISVLKKKKPQKTNIPFNKHLNKILLEKAGEGITYSQLYIYFCAAMADYSTGF